MTRPDHEDSAVARLMMAPLAEQATTMSAWGLAPAGLLILMSPCLGRCFFCAQPAVTHPPQSDWTQWTEVEKLLAGNPTAGLKHLCIGGTEPTTHPDFARAIRTAREQGFETIELMTSALRLAEPGAASRLYAAGIRTIATPIYSADPGTHDAVTGVSCHSELLAGLDAARAAGIEVRLHTLALQRTLAGLPTLAKLAKERWGAPLSLAPARPKDGVWDYDQEAPSLQEVSQALHTLAPGEIQLIGWPDCLAPGHHRGAAQVIELYFRGQARDFSSVCTDCSHRSRCPGVVSALLKRDGSEGLKAS